MSIYDDLGVTTVINASATLTVLGGSLMPPEVLAAMADAAAHFVDMHQYHEAAGRRLAELTGNDAAYVTAGGAAAISTAVLACVTRGRPELIERMPSGEGLPNEIVMHRAHRMPYDPAVRLVGARIVDIGNVMQTFPWELEGAIGPRTAAVLYVAGEHFARGSLPLDEVVGIAHSRGIPVIVDAAAQLPPVSNLWHFTKDVGADLALFSGGKGLRGPQSSGLIVGDSALIKACAANGAPNQRLIRAMKVGKEEIAGLLRAVELYVARDHVAELGRFEATCSYWISELSQVPGLTARRDWPNEAGQPLPRVLVEVDPHLSGRTAVDLAQALWDGAPRIAIAPADRLRFHITPELLQNGEERVVLERIRAAMSARGRGDGSNA